MRIFHCMWSRVIFVNSPNRVNETFLERQPCQSLYGVVISSVRIVRPKWSIINHSLPSSAMILLLVYLKLGLNQSFLWFVIKFCKRQKAACLTRNFFYNGELYPLSTYCRHYFFFATKNLAFWSNFFHKLIVNILRTKYMV